MIVPPTLGTTGLFGSAPAILLAQTQAAPCWGERLRRGNRLPFPHLTGLDPPLPDLPPPHGSPLSSFCSSLPPSGSRALPDPTGAGLRRALGSLHRAFLQCPGPLHYCNMPYGTFATMPAPVCWWKPAYNWAIRHLIGTQNVWE